MATGALTGGLRGLSRIRETAAYDALIRVPLILWYVYIASHVWGDLALYLDRADWDASAAAIVSSVAGRAVVLFFFATLVVFTVIRRRPRARAPGIWPRLTAVAGTFLLMILPLFPHRVLSLEMSALATLVVIAGNVLAIYVVFWLGRSLSIMAEARRLVTAGPYRFIRHPLYVAEELAVIGIFIQYASPWTFLLVCAHGMLQMMRMRNEERVLERAFPGEYAAYARTTSRLVPGVY